MTTKGKYTRWHYCLVLALSACQTLPPLSERETSSHLPAQTLSTLQAAYAPLAALHHHQSGVYPLEDSREAFAARLALAQAAEHSLDVQYYIWRNDTSGQMLFHELVKAAKRGVRVRLLLDDNNTAGLDNILVAISRQPNIEIRLFNPFVNRHWRALGYVTDFARLNRRMHNKSMTADNQATIVGGRNIGDEYFDIGNGTLFVDLDVLAVGPVVDDVSADFDRYWNSASAYPLSSIVTKRHDSLQADVPVFNQQKYNQVRADHYDDVLEQEDFLQRLRSARLPYEWSNMQLVSDNPAKALPQPRRHKNTTQTDAPANSDHAGRNSQSVAMVLDNLVETMHRPQHDMLLVSPYFVPTKAGVAALARLRSQGVRITVLTNSLAATDVPAVHSGYARYRKPLLRAGIELYELKNMGLVKGARDRGVTGSSASSLHAKTFVIDNKRLFVGSFNLDPRSAALNTEMGLLIQSPMLAEDVTASVHEALPELSYRTRINRQHHVEWQSTDDDGHIVIEHHEPQTGFWRRAWARVLSWLPIEWLL